MPLKSLSDIDSWFRSELDSRGILNKNPQTRELRKRLIRAFKCGNLGRTSAEIKAALDCRLEGAVFEGSAAPCH